jgi:hypothetical protein
MNQKANAGDDQEHNQRQGIEQEVKIGAKGSGGNPRRGEPLNVRQREAAEVQGDVQHHRQGRRGKEQRDGRDHGVGQTAAEQAVEQEAHERQHRNQPKMERR